MLKIAIVGSCITRDLWAIRGGGAERLLYISRTSFPSLLAPAINGLGVARTLPGDLRQHEHNALLADLRKTALGRLVAFRPTHLIFDFIDERFDLISTRSGLATHSAELARSGYLTKPAFRDARIVPRLSAACDRLWQDAAGAIAALVRGTELSRATPILHTARWATQQRGRDGRDTPIRDLAFLSGRPADLGAYNDLLERQETVFARLMPPMKRIDAGTLRVADPAHQWGLSPFHYVPDYYAEVRRQLVELGLADAFSDAPVAPSVRAG